MLLEDESSIIAIPQHNRKRRRRSFFFSSFRALTRSRMTRGKKVMSKTSNVGAIELYKPLQFEGGASTKEVVAIGYNFDTLHEGT